MTNAIIVNNEFIELSEVEIKAVLACIRELGTQTIAQPQATQPSQAKVYDHVSEDFSNFRFVLKDNTVTYTHADDKGTYLHEKAVRAALNTRIKACGGTWDKDAKAWVFSKNNKRDIKGAKAFVEKNSHAITADEINAVRDKWTEKAAKRASK